MTMRKNGQAKRRAKNTITRKVARKIASAYGRSDEMRTWHAETGWGEYTIRATTIEQATEKVRKHLRKSGQDFRNISEVKQILGEFIK